MAKSCVNIQSRSATSALLHNARTYGLSYAIDSDEKNYTEYMQSAKEIRSMMSNIKTDYQKHSYRGRRLPHTATPIKEGIMNLNEEHTNAEVMEVAKKVAKKLGVKLVGVSIHRDEGHINKDAEMKKNIHAHLLFNYYDFTTHKIVHQTSTQMKQMQTLVAQELKMKRGVAKSITKRKHIEHGQYRAVAKEKAEAVAVEKLTVAKMKREMETLRKQMAEANAELEAMGEQKVYTREDYAALGKLKKETKKETLSEVYISFIEMKETLLADVNSLKETNAELVKRVNSLIEENAELEKSVYSDYVYDQTQKPVPYKALSEIQKKKLERAEKQIETLAEETQRRDTVADSSRATRTPEYDDFDRVIADAKRVQQEEAREETESTHTQSRG